MKKISSRKWQKRGTMLSLHSVLFVALFIMCLPFLWMLSTSFKTSSEVLKFPPTWTPHDFTFENYVELFKAVDFIHPFYNSVFIALVSVAFSIVVCSLAAYAFAKFNFKGRDKLFMVLLGTMMVPGVVMQIPTFLLMKALGLINSYTGIILPAIASVGMIFFFRQFLLTISNDYIEAARIDGAGEIRIFWSIILPMMRPALVAQGIFAFTASWNSFMWPLIIATDDRFYTLPLALTQLDGQHSSNYGLSMSGAIVVIIPLVILFMFTQKYFLNSMNIGGVKE
ncbi:MAG TPA: carbohydrate ABC transporter permease [Burkholderiales bacterium]|nr:carbohydrate ABC transporter permease [Burkholderiales bacterium]